MIIARGQLLEVIDGIEIRARAPVDPLTLLPGRRGRLEAGGPVYEVHRVSDAAAYLFKVYDPPRTEVIGSRAQKDALEEALPGLREAISSGDPGKAYQAARAAGHAAGDLRSISVSRGPVEPGIAARTRFCERT